MGTAMALTLSAAMFSTTIMMSSTVDQSYQEHTYNLVLDMNNAVNAKDGAQPTAKQGALATVIPHAERSPSSVERSPSTWESLRASALPTSTWLAEILRPQGCEDSSGFLVGTFSET